MKPTSAIIAVTLNCNARCVMCDIWKQDGKGQAGEMLPQEYRKLPASLRDINLTGGEPFLNEDIFDMIEYGHSKKIHVSTTTNGTILDDKIDRIIESSLSKLNISLDADNSSDYQRMHGENMSVFYAVLENITKLVEKKKMNNHHLKLSVSYICDKRNYMKIPDMIYFAEELGVDELIFHNLIPFNLLEFPKNEALFDNDEDVMKVLEDINKHPNSKLQVTMPRLYTRRIIERFCRMPFTTLPINGEGDVSMCCNIPVSSKYGNLFDENYDWNKFHFKEMRNILMDRKEPLPETCILCPNMYRPYNDVRKE